MVRKLGKVFSILLVVLITLSVFLGAFSAAFHDEEFIVWSLRGSGNYLTALTANSHVLQYLHGETDSLVLDIFTEEEISHLSDVRSVLWWLNNGLAFCLMMMVFILLYSVYNGVKLNLGRVALYSSCACFSLLILMAIIPFDILFDLMHRLLFEEGTYAFPLDSALIQIYPLKFWKTMGLHVVLKIFSLSVLLLSLAIFALSGKRVVTISK